MNVRFKIRNMMYRGFRKELMDRFQTDWLTSRPSVFSFISEVKPVIETRGKELYEN